MKQALIIGSTCVDIIINIDHLPSTAENLRPTSQSMVLGGCAYNVSYIMRLLSAPHTFISPVGGGMYGDYVAKCLKAQGMPVAVRIPEKDNGCCYCLVEASGERTFMSCHGVEYTFQKLWMEPYNPDNYHLTYVCGLEIEEATGINLIEYLESHPQLEVCYAPGPRGTFIESGKTDRMMALQPILHVNQQEAMDLSGQPDYASAARSLQALTHNTVIITLGERGTYCLEKDGDCYLIPSTPAAHVVDTIGAGDSHVGTILACLTRGMSLRESIAYANKVAAAVVGVAGSSLPPDLLPPLA